MNQQLFELWHPIFQESSMRKWPLTFTFIQVVISVIILEVTVIVPVTHVHHYLLQTGDNRQCSAKYTIMDHQEFPIMLFRFWCPMEHYPNTLDTFVRTCLLNASIFIIFLTSTSKNIFQIQGNIFCK